MDNTTVFSKTGKGLLEVKNRSNRVSKEQYRVLSLIDGKANLDELADRARMNPTALRQILTQLTDGGYVKVLVSSAASDPGMGSSVATGSYYVDDLDFTAVLGPAGKRGPSIYQSTETERRQRESAERKAAEAASTRKREEEEKRKQAEAATQAKAEAAARQLREEAEKKARLETQRMAQLEAEMKARLDNERKLKEAEAAKARALADAKLKADLDRQIREANLLRQKEDEARRLKEEEARQRKEAEERQRREAAEKARLEEEARRRKEEEARQRMEAEERQRREAEEKARREAEEKARREEEARRRKEEEARQRKEAEERQRREAEEKARREEDDRRRQEEEARQRKEAEERQRREAEEKARRDEEERHRQEQEARQRKEAEERQRLEAEEKARRDEEERHRREQEARQRKEAEERQRREAEERARREEAEQRLKDEEARKERERLEALAEQKRLEEEVLKRKAVKQRQRQEPKDDDFQGLAEVGPGPNSPEEERWLLREIGISTKDGLEPGVAAEMAAGPAESPRSLLDDFSIPAASAMPPAPASQPEWESVMDATSASLALPEVSEEIEYQPADEPPSGAGVRMPVAPIGELDIRGALEEQERRLRMEEEARAAVERAEAEEQIKAEREAREIAEATERARREDALRAREEADRLAREEKERRELEEEERRLQREVDRRAREQARQEAERRKREEDLARQRKEQEERELRKAERDRVHKEIRRSNVTPARVALVAMALLMILCIGILQFASLSAWAPDIERVASRRVGEPVRIASVHANVFPEFQLILEGVTVGVAQDVQANTVVLSPQVGSLFSEKKALDKLQIQGVTGSIDALARAGGWLNGPGSNSDLVRVPLVVVSDLTLTIPGVTLPKVNLTVKLGQGGAVLSAAAATVDEHLNVDFLPREADVEIAVRGRNFTLPVGPSVEVMDLEGKGVLAKGRLRLEGVEYFLLGGKGNAQIDVAWSDGWFLETNFDLQHMSVDASMRALGIQLVSEGSLDAKGVARLRSPSFASLFTKPEISANFKVERGNLAGLDLPRALQQRSRDGVQGGQTRFEEFTGVFQSRDGAYQYRSLKLQAGVLKGAGQADIAASGEITGRVQSELRSSAGLIRGGFLLSGNQQAMSLRQ